MHFTPIQIGMYNQVKCMEHHDVARRLSYSRHTHSVNSLACSSYLSTVVKYRLQKTQPNDQSVGLSLVNQRSDDTRALRSKSINVVEFTAAASAVQHSYSSRAAVELRQDRVESI
jgi:hypothetical protein